MRKYYKRVYTPYWEWEDWKAGMWETQKDDGSLLLLAIDFTGDYVEYGKSMVEAVTNWDRTMLNALTNYSLNQRAFVGHCGACLRHGLPEVITRKAWSHLTDKQRFYANREADKAILIWRRKYESTLKNGKEDVIKTASPILNQMSFGEKFHHTVGS